MIVLILRGWVLVSSNMGFCNSQMQHKQSSVCVLLRDVSLHTRCHYAKPANALLSGWLLSVGTEPSQGEGDIVDVRGIASPVPLLRGIQGSREWVGGLEGDRETDRESVVPYPRH